MTDMENKLDNLKPQTSHLSNSFFFKNKLKEFF
jgi:hypothetical protein